MADFLTRVELFGADPDDYERLDQAMKARNFVRTHLSARGVLFQLPNGTYFSQASNMSPTDVRNLALDVVRNIGRRYDVVTMSGDMSYFLHPAR